MFPLKLLYSPLFEMEPKFEIAELEEHSKKFMLVFLKHTELAELIKIMLFGRTVFKILKCLTICFLLFVQTTLQQRH